MKDNEIRKAGFFDATFAADDRTENGEQKHSPIALAIEVISAQLLKVDLELSSGILHKNKFISQSTKRDFVWVSDSKIDVMTSLGGATLITTSAIVAIHFPKEREYLMTQKR